MLKCSLIFFFENIKYKEFEIQLIKTSNRHIYCALENNLYGNTTGTYLPVKIGQIMPSGLAFLKYMLSTKQKGYSGKTQLVINDA